MKNLHRLLSLFLITSGVAVFSDAANPKNFSHITVDESVTVTGSSVTVNGMSYLYPSTISAGVTIPTYDSTTRQITHQTAITDAVRRGSYNVISGSTTINDFPLVFEELGSIPCPPTGKRALGAKSDGFYQVDSSCGESMVGTGSGSGSGGWTTSGSVALSTYTVVAGTNSASGVNSTTIFQAQRGAGIYFDVGTTSASFRNVSGIGITNAGTYSITGTRFDVSGATVVIPGYTSSNFTGQEIWWDTDDRTLKIGTHTISGVGGGSASFTGWTDSGSPNVTYSTKPVSIGTQAPASIPAGVIMQVSTGTTTLMTVSSTATTHTGVSYLALQNAVWYTQAMTVMVASTTVNISTHQNNFSIAGNYTLYMTSATENLNITGFENNDNGRVFTLLNVGVGTITITGPDTDSDDEYEVMTTGFTIPPFDSASFFYDGNILSWRRIR